MVKKISTVLILVIMVGSLLWTVITPKKTVSSIENRSTARAIPLTLESYKDKSFAQGTEEYLNDQFPLRDLCIIAKQVLNSRKNNGCTIVKGSYGYEYAITKDGMILSALKEKKNPDYIDIWVNKINEAAELCEERDIDIFYAVTPSKVELFEELLPNSLQCNMDYPLFKSIFDRLDDSVKIINMFDDFAAMPKEEVKNYFYKTDSHWNYRGSYKGFEILSSKLSDMGFNTDLSKYEFAEIDNDCPDFLGQYNSALGGRYTVEEDFTKYVPNDGFYENLKLYMLSDGIETEVALTTAVESKTSGEGIGYGTITCIDTDYLHFVNPDALNHYSLVVIKDSFFCGMIPNISLLFDDVYVIDTRYTKEFVLSDFFDEYYIDGLMYFYNSSSYVKIDENQVDNLITNYSVIKN